MLVHKTSVNILKMFEVIQSIFSDHKRIKREASKIPRITLKIWKLKNLCLTHGSKKKSQGNLEGAFNWIIMKCYIVKCIDAAKEMPRRKDIALNVCIWKEILQCTPWGSALRSWGGGDKISRREEIIQIKAEINVILHK